MSMPVQSTTPPQSGKPALRSGAIMGFALGAIHSTIVIITSQFSGSLSNRLATILYLVLPLIWIIGLLIAGAWGSLTTGKVSTGSLAGVFAGTFGGILAAFGHVIAAALTISQSN
ncbi:MAG TPA: hypothetical protein VFN35_08170, partial [Ktedonobacteraceae bacterium]|nr:hypothetical protein [Ktedonobacteraceae bacterium]